MRTFFIGLSCIAANAVPLFGILSLGWEPAIVLLIYWLEFIVVGLFGIPKILRASGDDDPDELPSMVLAGESVETYIGEPRRTLVWRLVYVFGLCWLIYGVLIFVFVFVTDQTLELSQLPVDTLLIGLAALAAFHLVDLITDFIGDGHYERTGPVRQLVNPIQQIMPLHVAIILGGFVGGCLGGGGTDSGMSMGVLIVLVVVKTISDLVRVLRRQPGRTP